MRRSLLAALLAGLSFLATGCQAGDAPTRGASSVWDSAGIEIVESADPAWDGDGWSVADRPSVVIGRVEGDERYLFGFVSGGVVLRDGRIAVLDGQSALIRVYSSEGVHLEDWGGRGEGPGEFDFPGNIFRYRGDSILVNQIIPLRFVIFDDRGRFGRNAVPKVRPSDLPPGADEPSAVPTSSCCAFWGPLPVGGFLFSYPEMVPSAASGTRRGSVSVGIVADSGGAAEPGGVFRGARHELGPQGSRVTHQFAPRVVMAGAPGGYLVTEGEAYSIHAHDASGRPRRIIRLAREPRPVTDGVRAAHEDQLRERFSRPGGRVEGGSRDEALRRALSAPYPSHLPTFQGLHVDPEGTVWALQRPYRTADGGEETAMNEFFVFHADGRHLGVVELPAKLRVLQIGTDFILAAVSDDLGVNFVHLHRIEK